MAGELEAVALSAELHAAVTMAELQAAVCRADALAPRENDEQIVQFNLLESLRLVEVSSTSFSFIASLRLGIVASCRAPSSSFSKSSSSSH